MSSAVIAAIEHRLRESAYNISIDVELPPTAEVWRSARTRPSSDGDCRIEVLFLLEGSFLYFAKYFRCGSA